MNDTPDNEMNEQAASNAWEEQLNALLEGDLDAEQTRQLEAAARENPALARAIIEACELQRALEAIPMHRAPATLRRKLARIPTEQRREARPISFRTASFRTASFWTGLWGTGWFRTGWVTALAAVPVLIIALSLRGPAEPGVAEPTAAQISQAQRELAIAFSYLEKVGRQAGQEIGATVNHEMQQSINQNMIRTIQDQMEFNKERNA